MKIQHIDTPIGAIQAPSPLRRKLLLGLPSGFALATPFALIGCGGSDDDASTTPPPASGGGTVDPPGPLATSTMSVSIQLPDAIAAAAGAMQVISATGASTVTANAADVAVIADGPQLVSVIGADGRILALGWAGKDQPPVSPQSTAAVLLSFGLGLPFLGSGARDGLRTRLLSQPAVATFGDRIAAELRADPKALTTMSPGIVDAFAVASDALLPASATAARRERALGLIVQPAVDQSGLQVVQGEALNSFFVDNAYVRRAVVVVNREGWTDSTGDHDDPAAPVQVGEVMDLPLPTAIDSVANVVGGWANEYYAPDDQNGFWRSVTDATTLEITPADAKRTRYNVVVLTAGALPPADAQQFARLPASQKAYVTGLDLDKNLSLQMLLLDLLAPFFFEFLSSRIGAGGKAPVDDSAKADAEVLKAFAMQMLTILQTRLPDVTQKLSDGSTDAWTAFKTILKACTFDPNTGEISPLLQEFLTQGAQLCAKSLADVGLRSRMLDIATGLQVGGKGVLGLLPVLRIMAEFDKVLSKAALVRIVADFLRSQRMVSWSIAATKAKVVLRPDPLELDAATVTYPIKAEIVDNDNDDYGREKGSINFDWDCTGLYGSLYSPIDTNLANPNHFTTSTVNATVNYLPSGAKPDPANPDTVTVKAYFEPIGSSGTRTLIGTATAPLKFKQEFTVSMSPSSKADLPADTAFPLKAFLNEKVPAGSSIAWEWTHSGAGLLDAPPVDGFVVDSTATLNTGSTEGTANISVRATVKVPAINGAPARTVVTDPIAGTFGVKKGLRTLTFEAGGGVFACGPTCGVEDYTAFIVPKIPKALSYTAVLSGYGYASCNRSVTWNSTKADGGGCNFPVTYHPFAAGEAAAAWAVWIGFGGPFSGKCVVTVTLSA